MRRSRSSAPAAPSLRVLHTPTPAAVPGPRPAPAGPAHVLAVGHVGMFTHASCSACGWRGPGRRAASRAQDDADAHRLLA